MRTPAAVTTCKEHGRHNAGNNKYERGVNLPETKRQRHSGCPECRKEKHQEEAKAKRGGAFHWLQSYLGPRD